MSGEIIAGLLAGKHPFGQRRPKLRPIRARGEQRRAERDPARIARKIRMMKKIDRARRAAARARTIERAKGLLEPRWVDPNRFIHGA